VIVGDEPPIRIVEQNDVSVVEGDSGVTHVLHYTVTKMSDYDIPVTVTYGGRDGSATMIGGDYATGGTLTFAPGEFSKTIDVTIYGDRLHEETIYSQYDPSSDTYYEYSEPYEYFSVALTGSDYGSTGGEARIYIQDDDEKPTISISDVTMAEGKRGQTTLFTF